MSKRTTRLASDEKTHPYLVLKFGQRWCKDKHAHNHMSNRDTLAVLQPRAPRRGDHRHRYIEHTQSVTGRLRHTWRRRTALRSTQDARRARSCPTISSWRFGYCCKCPPPCSRPIERSADNRLNAEMGIRMAASATRDHYRTQDYIQCRGGAPTITTTSLDHRGCWLPGRIPAGSMCSAPVVSQRTS